MLRTKPNERNAVTAWEVDWYLGKHWKYWWIDWTIEYMDHLHLHLGLRLGRLGLRVGRYTKFVNIN